MRIPPYNRSVNWQRFFSGVFIGAIISWLIFIYMFGELQEKQTKTIKKQQEFIADLEKEKQIWQEDFKKLNEKNKQLLTVNEIQVKIINADQYHIDPLSAFEIEKVVKEDIRMVLAKDVELIFNSREFIRKAIENKYVEINDKRYRLAIKEMVIYTTLIIHIQIKLAE